MDALEWAWIGLMSVAWLLLFRRVRERVAFEHRHRRPSPESRAPVATRPPRLWLDHKPPTA